MENIFKYPLISIIIVNFNGKDYLKICLESIRKLNYPKDRIELIVVDNGSSDDSTEFLSLNFPQVKVIKNNSNLGFAVANNQGARLASGEYIAFLNNDTKVDDNWLIELLAQVYHSNEVVCAGSKVLSFDGNSLDFVGSMINFEGKGFQLDYGIDISKDVHNQSVFLPFVNGGAMIVKKQVFLDSGGFDEDFFAYYEDVDFGWRLWVLGYKVVFAPKSIVYHIHHGTSKIFSEDKLRFLKERNALYSVFKNYDDENLARAFSGTLASIYSRIFTGFKFDYKKYYDFSVIDSDKKSVDAGVSDKASIDNEPLSSLMAVKNFFDKMPELLEKGPKYSQTEKGTIKRYLLILRDSFWQFLRIFSIKKLK